MSTPALFFFLFFSIDLAQSLVFNPNKGEGNPLRGVVGSDSYPSSLRFSYFGLADVMKGMNNFDWTPFERLVAETAAKGVQLIPRFFVNYPGESNSIPRDLVNSISLINGEPDWNDPDLVSALVNFITAYGRKYNGDIRIAFVETGLLGQWGEWHGNPMSASTEEAVLSAYETYFPTTKILTRYGDHTGTKTISARRVGFHDDSFSRETLDWFWGSIVGHGGANVWETQPIGGEVRPEDDCLWDEPKCAWPMQSFSQCVSTTHTTYMKCPLSKNPTTFRNGVKEVVLMGYHFYVSNIQKTQGANDVTYTISIVNNGVAPFYYPISMDVYTDTKKFPVTNALQGLKPATPKVFSVTIPLTDVKETMQLKLTSPRILPSQFIRFSNDEVEYDGSLSLGLPPLRPMLAISNTGCYTDSSNPRTLSTSVSYAGQLSHETCYQACAAKGYTLAGVTYGVECWCGSTVTANTISSSSCNMMCGGNNKQPCGGYFAINVLKKVAPLRSLGCFQDSSVRVLKGPNFVFATGNSYERCWQTCNDKGFSVAGVQFGNECYCGTPSDVPSSASPEVQCDMSCSGNAAQKCGGFFRMNIIVKWNSTLTARQILSGAAESSGVTEGSGITSSGDSTGPTTVTVTSPSVQNSEGVPGYAVGLLVLTSLLIVATLVALVLLVLRR